MANVFFIPSGPKNLASIFPAIDWDNVKSYSIEVTDGASTIATSPVMKICCNPDDFVRLHFVNSLGGIDAVDFMKPHIVHEDTNSEYQGALNFPLQKKDTGIERFNVKGNDTYEVKQNFYENDMPWLRELADSPKIFLEWKGTEGQADDYIPVVKIADKFDLLKNDQEYRYTYTIQFKLSNEYLTIRN